MIINNDGAFKEKRGRKRFEYIVVVELCEARLAKVIEDEDGLDHLENDVFWTRCVIFLCGQSKHFKHFKQWE